jgi:hypothetical protein
MPAIAATPSTSFSFPDVSFGTRESGRVVVVGVVGATVEGVVGATVVVVVGATVVVVGATVVNETVLLALVPRESATEYVSVDVPTKSASPVNVTTPVEVFTEYDPSPVIVRVVAVQFGAVSPEPHRRTDDVVIVAPDAPVSFDAGFIVIAIAVPPDAVSARAVGGTAHCTTTMPSPPIACESVPPALAPTPIGVTHWLLVSSGLAMF